MVVYSVQSGYSATSGRYAGIRRLQKSVPMGKDGNRFSETPRLTTGSRNTGAIGKPKMMP
jgi:hypothetical protein